MPETKGKGMLTPISLIIKKDLFREGGLARFRICFDNDILSKIRNFAFECFKCFKAKTFFECASTFLCLCVCVCVREREREMETS